MKKEKGKEKKIDQRDNIFIKNSIPLFYFNSSTIFSYAKKSIKSDI